jgi:hypothetical protein
MTNHTHPLDDRNPAHRITTDPAEKPHAYAVSLEISMKRENTRCTTRLSLSLPARITWKDRLGATHIATVVTRNVSEFGVYVECLSPVSIPLYRLVQFQLEQGRLPDLLPSSLRRARIPAAVYRVSQTLESGRWGLALRLIVEPRHALATSPDNVQVLAS